MNVLVLNCGSSSVKFQLIATDLERIAANTDLRLARGAIERIGGEAIITFRAEGRAPQRSTANTAAGSPGTRSVASRPGDTTPRPCIRD